MSDELEPVQRADHTMGANLHSHETNVLDDCHSASIKHKIAKTTCILLIPVYDPKHVFCILSTKVLGPINTILFDGVDSNP